MKRLFFTLMAFVFFSCATTSSSGDQTTKKPSKKLLKGTWGVTTIRFVGDKGLYKANLFDLADSVCFKGSEWVFIPNNGSGKFTINSTASQCTDSSNRIHWSFYDAGNGIYQFQFKYVDDKNKPLDAANRGFRCNIDEINAEKMVMRVATEYKGNPFDVVLTYNKISEDFSLN